MTYFPTSKLLRLAAQRAVRTAYLQEAQAAAADNIYTIDRIVQQALPAALNEQADFHDMFGEPMPAHLVTALNAEICLWEHLHDQLTAFTKRTVTQEDLDAYTLKVRQYLAIQHDVLRMQEELATSCLVQHYRDLTDELLTAASAVDL